MNDTVERLRRIVFSMANEEEAAVLDAIAEIGRMEKENARLMRLLPFYERVAEMASDWCGQIDNVGTGWDDWDSCFKEMKWKVLPALNKSLEESK